MTRKLNHAGRLRMSQLLELDIEKLAERCAYAEMMLRDISEQYANQNLGHADFRVAAKIAADAALED